MGPSAARHRAQIAGGSDDGDPRAAQRGLFDQRPRNRNAGQAPEGQAGCHGNEPMKVYAKRVQPTKPDLGVAYLVQADGEMQSVELGGVDDADARRLVETYIQKKWP